MRLRITDFNAGKLAHQNENCSKKLHEILLILNLSLRLKYFWEPVIYNILGVKYLKFIYSEQHIDKYFLSVFLEIIR